MRLFLLSSMEITFSVRIKKRAFFLDVFFGRAVDDSGHWEQWRRVEEGKKDRGGCPSRRALKWISESGRGVIEITCHQKNLIEGHGGVVPEHLSGEKYKINFDQEQHA